MSPVQIQCIDLLIAGHSMEAAARKLNVSSRTIRRWKKEPEFAEELSENLNDLRDHLGCLSLASARQSHEKVQAAFDAVTPLLKDTDPNVVIRAAKAMTEMSVKMQKLLMAAEIHEQKMRAAAEKAQKSAPPVQATAPISGQNRTSAEASTLAPVSAPSAKAPEPGQFRTDGSFSGLPRMQVFDHQRLRFLQN